MTFSCTCPACEHVNHVEWSRIGREMFCGGCGKPFVIPAPMETVARSTAPKAKDTVRFRCPACGKKYSTSGKLAGQKIRCKGCGGGVRVPSGEAPPASHSTNFKRKFSGIENGSPSNRQPEDSAARPAVHPSLPDLDRLPRSEPEAPVENHEDDEEESVDDLSPILDNPSVLEGQAKRHKMREAVLGSRTEAVARASREAAEEAAKREREEWDRAQRIKKLQKKKRSGYFDPKETLQFVGYVSAFVGTLAFLAWGYPDFRFPLGGLLCVTGFIVYRIGGVSLRQLVAEEGAIKAIVFRVFPPYQWWFIWTRWSDAKDYAIFFAAGFLIMSIGGAVIKMSPIGKRAELSQQAYEKMRKQSQEKFATPPEMPKRFGINAE